MLDGAGILEWVRNAKPADMAVYARGDNPPRILAALVSRLSDQGLIDPTRRRDGTGWQFLIQRRAKAFSAAPGMRRGRNYGRASAETVILRMVREAIRLGQPCPTNSEFAEVAGLSGRLAASYRLRKLVRDGKLTLVDHGPYERRVAILTESGLSTARAKL